MSGFYLQPVGLLYGEVAREGKSCGVALPLASGSIAFSAVRIWEGEPGCIKHTTLTVREVRASGEPRVKELLGRLSAPRKAIIGVSMNAPRIMGIVNVTPDSFSDGGGYVEPAAAIGHARALAGSGADFIDIGGESTRPGAAPVSAEEEWRRLMPVLSGLAGQQTPLSIDTRKPEVMRRASAIRADLINDISALSFSPDSLATAADIRKPVVLMHAQGDPKTMQENPAYRDVVIEVYDYLEKRIEAAASAGLPRETLIADPGIGFGKTAEHNAAILRNVSLFHGLGVPLLIGTSRKRSLQAVARVKSPKQQTSASVASALDAISQGVQIVRVHNVEETRQALAIWNWLRGRPDIQ